MLIEEAGVLFGQVFHGLLFDELNAQARGVPNLNMTVDDDALGQTTDDLVPQVWGVGIFECIGIIKGLLGRRVKPYGRLIALFPAGVPAFMRRLLLSWAGPLDEKGCLSL